MSDPVETRLQRIETKLDDLHQVVVSLARIEERQVSHGQEAKRLHERVDGIEGRVKMLEGRTGWLPGVERLFWVAVAAVAAWLTKFTG